MSQLPAAPVELSIPEPGLSVILQCVGVGVQIYVPAGQTPGGWTLQGPEAELRACEDGRILGRHFAGPTWELIDGSRVTGRVLTKAPATDPHAIPQLLLAVSENSDRGQLAGARYIQRLETSGGLAPATAPAADTASVRVEYRATYLFWG